LELNEHQRLAILLDQAMDKLVASYKLADEQFSNRQFRHLVWSIRALDTFRLINKDQMVKKGNTRKKKPKNKLNQAPIEIIDYFQA